MSEILELRRGSDLSQQEKNTIISTILNAGENKNQVKTRLAAEYSISEHSISSLLAHDTMRRQKEQGQEHMMTPEIIQGSIQEKIYTITNISGISDNIRHSIFIEFQDITNEHAGETGYDYYEDIGAISEYYDIDPAILEEYLKIRFKWLTELLDSLKKNENTDKLTIEDKMTIRDYVESGIDKVDKKKRRKEMSLKHGVSIYTIGAITAWKKGEDGNMTLGEKSPGVPKIPSIPDEVSIQSEGIIESSGETTNSSIHEEDSPDEVIDNEFILDLAKGFDLNDDTERHEFLDDVFDCFPDATLEDIKRIIPDFPDDKTHTNQIRSGEGMGALIEYNNEIKNKWRQKLKEFIDENTDIEKRKDMKVLCLPGLKCLEIPLYLELGFRPENIVGVEAGIVKGKKDPELIQQFEENAKKYGIQTRIGKLEKILETEETVFDVVSLDFLGGWSILYKDILKNLSLSDNSIVLTNFLGRRDSRLRESWFDFEKKRNPKIILDSLDSYALNGGNYEFHRQRMNKYLSDNNQLSVLREEGLSSLIAGNLTIGLNTETHFYRKIRNLFDLYRDASKRSANIELNILGSLSIDFAPLIYAAMKQSYKNKTIIEIDTTYKIFNILFQFITQTREVQEITVGKYKTTKGTPMFFDFFKLKKINDDYSFILPFIRFATTAIQVLCDHAHSEEYSIAIQRFHKDGLTQRDVVEVRKRGLVIGSIKLSELFNAYTSYLKKYKTGTLLPKERIRFEL